MSTFGGIGVFLDIIPRLWSVAYALCASFAISDGWPVDDVTAAWLRALGKRLH